MLAIHIVFLGKASLSLRLSLRNFCSKMDYYQLEKKVNRLILLYRELEEKQVRTIEQLESLKLENAQLLAENIVVKKRLSSTSLGHAFAANGDIELAKKEVENVLRELNHCIALLNNE